MKKQIVRMALLGATAGTMLVASALILPTVALSTAECAVTTAATLQSPGCPTADGRMEVNVHQGTRNQ